MKLSITTNFPQVQASLAKLRADVGRQAMASAINKVVTQAKTAMQREIAGEFNVKVGYVRDRLRVRKAYAGGSLALSAELAASSGKGRSANVIAFVERSVTLAQARKRSKDGSLRVLRVKIKRGAVKPLPGAFIGNKGRTVFKRVGRARLPIVPVRTIDVAQMFNTRRINARVVAMINAKLPGIFEHEARFYIARAAAR